MCFPINFAATTAVWILFTTGHMMGGRSGAGEGGDTADSSTQPVSHLRHRALWYSKGMRLLSDPSRMWAVLQGLENPWKDRLKKECPHPSFLPRHASPQECTTGLEKKPSPTSPFFGHFSCSGTVWTWWISHVGFYCKFLLVLRA